MKGADPVYSLGSDEYIQYVVEKYSRTLLRVAYNIVRSTAESEDIVQDVLLSLITRSPDFESDEHEKAWLIRATVNRAKNTVKRSARFISDENALSLCCEESSGVDIEQRGELLSAVLSLPNKYSVPVHLYYYEGYSTAETAKILRLPQATVCTRLARARAMLKKMLSLDFEI